MNTFEIIDRPRPEAFTATLSFQQQLVQAKAEDRSLADFLVFVEHDDVYTLGRGSSAQELLFPTKKTLPWIEISRGGQATYHGPGQLVCYPIFDLERHGKDVHVLLRNLEQVIIKTLQKFSVEAFSRKGLTGVWVNSDESMKKIASLGIGVRRWISYHGLALNVCPDLSYFRAISPCGQDGDVMTSLAEILGEDVPTLEQVKEEMIRGFRETFRFDNKTRAPERPRWLKVRAPGSAEFLETQQVIKTNKLVTVCEEAHCPNIGECWSHQTATFMLMGELCTRRCSFCAVKDGSLETLRPLDDDEPYRVAVATTKLGLRHVVVTSVNRDDLADMGAEHFHQTARAIHQLNPNCAIEFLIPDMQGKRELLSTILQGAFLSILNHNLETVTRLYRHIRPGASLRRSLNILRWAKEIQPSLRTKSGLMVGLGEKKEEVLAVMDELRAVSCDILTIGQYLQPTSKQLPVERFVTPDEFKDYEEEGKKRGFSFVESGPFVRSSYHAWKHSTSVTPSQIEMSTVGA